MSIKATNQNPFKSCATFEDVFAVIRTKCEQLRGKKFRRFAVGRVFLSYGRLRFTIEADYTIGLTWGDGHRERVGWYDLICGHRGDRFPSGSKLRLYRGQGFVTRIDGGGGGSGSKPNTHWSSVSIELKHLPLIKKLHAQNGKRAARATTVHDRPYPYTAEDRAVQQAATELQTRVMAWRKKNYDDYVERYPQIDLRTGKPIKDKRS